MIYSQQYFLEKLSFHLLPLYIDGLFVTDLAVLLSCMLLPDHCIVRYQRYVRPSCQILLPCFCLPAMKYMDKLPHVPWKVQMSHQKPLKKRDKNFSCPAWNWRVRIWQQLVNFLGNTSGSWCTYAWMHHHTLIKSLAEGLAQLLFEREAGRFLLIVQLTDRRVELDVSCSPVANQLNHVVWSCLC